jgi:hypothetical protein
MGLRFLTRVIVGVWMTPIVWMTGKEDALTTGSMARGFWVYWSNQPARFNQPPILGVL